MDDKILNESNGQLVNEWFLFRDCNKFGPLTANDIAVMLDKNQINKDHHIWHQKYNSWVAIKDVDIFQNVGFEIQFPKKQVAFIETANEPGFAAKPKSGSSITSSDKAPSLLKRIFGFLSK